MAQPARAPHDHPGLHIRRRCRNARAAPRHLQAAPRCRRGGCGAAEGCRPPDGVPRRAGDRPGRRADVFRPRARRSRGSGDAGGGRASAATSSIYGETGREDCAGLGGEDQELPREQYKEKLRKCRMYINNKGMCRLTGGLAACLMLRIDRHRNKSIARIQAKHGDRCSPFRGRNIHTPRPAETGRLADRSDWREFIGSAFARRPKVDTHFP